MRIDLPSGGWAELKEPEDLTYGERLPIEGGSRKIASRSSNGGADQVDEEIDIVVLKILVSAWSYSEEPHNLALPKDDPTSLHKCTAHDVDRMRIEAVEIMPKLFLNIEPDIEQDSPTSASITN